MSDHGLHVYDLEHNDERKMSRGERLRELIACGAFIFVYPQT